MHAHVHTHHCQPRRPCSGLPTSLGRNTARRATSTFSIPHYEAPHKGFTHFKTVLDSEVSEKLAKSSSVGLICFNLFYFQMCLFSIKSKDRHVCDEQPLEGNCYPAPCIRAPGFPRTGITQPGAECPSRFTRIKPICSTHFSNSRCSISSLLPVLCRVLSHVLLHHTAGLN